MARLSIVDMGDYDGARVFQLFRMDLGTDRYYPVAFRSDEEFVHPPTIREVLDYFGISPHEWEGAASDAE